MLDRLIVVLAAFIAALVVTGGVRLTAGDARLELAQVDAFAWALLALLAVRRWRRGDWLPPALFRASEHAAAALERHPRAWLALGVVVYASLHVWISARRFDSFHANAWDLGFVDQALWCTARGGGFLHADMAKGGSYLGEHFSPALAIGSIAYLVTTSIRGLFVFQTLTLAAGAPLAYALARARGATRGAAALAGLCLLAYRPLRAANVFDLHEDDLLVPLFLGLLLAMETRRRAWFWALALASWFVKELAPFYTAMLGAWLIARGDVSGARDTRTADRARDSAPGRGPGRADGIALFAASCVAFVVLVAVVTPRLAGGGGETVLVRRLGALGGLGATSGDILRAAVIHPAAFWGDVLPRFARAESIKYLAQVGAPFVAFAAAAPAAALIALAGALFNIAFVRHGVGFHYECALIPFLVYVLASGLARPAAAGELSAPEARTALPPVRLALVVLGFLLFFGRGPLDAIRTMSPTDHDRAVAATLARLPAGATVAAHAALYPHITHRTHAALLPRGLGDADYVAIDRSPGLSVYDTPDLDALSDTLAASGAQPVAEHETFTLWRRGPATGAGAATR